MYQGSRPPTLTAVSCKALMPRPLLERSGSCEEEDDDDDDDDERSGSCEEEDDDDDDGDDKASAAGK